MCQHSLSAQQVTEKIENEIFPDMIKLFQIIEKKHERWSSITSLNENLYDRIQRLKSAFSQLSAQEFEHVFPNVLTMFNTKEDADFKPKVDVLAWQQKSLEQELEMQKMVKEIAAVNYFTEPFSYELQTLIKTFQLSYQNEKDKWNHLLEGWQRNCACFRMRLPEVAIN